MAKRIKKGGGAVGFVLILVALAMLVVAIVGVCIDWISTKVTAAGYTGEPIFQSLSELFDDFKDSDSDIAGKFKLMAAFAILTVILAGGTTVFAGITKVLGWKLFKFLLVVIAIVCVICGVCKHNNHLYFLRSDEHFGRYSGLDTDRFKDLALHRRMAHADRRSALRTCGRRRCRKELK